MDKRQARLDALREISLALIERVGDVRQDLSADDRKMVTDEIWTHIHKIERRIGRLNKVPDVQKVAKDPPDEQMTFNLTERNE